MKFYALRLYERILRSESWALVLCLALNQRATEPPRVAQSLLGTPDAHRCHQESDLELIADSSLNSVFCKNGCKYGAGEAGHHSPLEE